MRICLCLVIALCLVGIIGCAPRGEATPSPSSGGAASPADTGTPAAGPLKTIHTKTGVEMVLLPGGNFLMGDEQGEDDEKPAHEVQVSPFSMDVTEVTQQSYQALMGRNPAKFAGPTRPVERISWHAAMLYCNMRSRREGLTPCYDPKTQQCDFSADGYRLPTEAEWEYACRAGSPARWSFGDAATDAGRSAWFKDNAAKTTHPVKQKSPNAWGLCDMHGNVAEWCNDRYADHYDPGPARDPRGPTSGDDRVLRGGSWNKSVDSCRCASRRSEAPALADTCFGSEAYGFRCVRKR